MKNPSILAFSRSLSPSHVLMYSTGNNPGAVPTAILIREEPLRGLNATTKSLKDGKSAEAVLQVVESAELAPGDDTLLLRGKLTASNALLAPHSCNQVGFAEVHQALINNAAADGLVEELACRYALNLASGKWAWRNALEADAVQVDISWTEDGVPQEVTFQDLLLSTENTFDLDRPEYAQHKDAICKLGRAMAKAMTRPSGYCTIFAIEARLHMGLAARVYPSQEWPSEDMKKESVARWGKDSSGVTRILAKLRGQHAILNDRKVGNALRVIDTWYGADKAGRPIAVEPYGANSHQAVAFRTNKGSSAFDMVGAICEGKALRREEILFYVASCVRGGVYGATE